jgi:hypothetical protein
VARAIVGWFLETSLYLTGTGTRSSTECRTTRQFRPESRNPSVEIPMLLQGRFLVAAHGNTPTGILGQLIDSALLR